MKLHKTLLAASVAALLVGCGGGSSDNPDTTQNTPQTNTAQFVDGYVQGLKYVNDSREDFTNEYGEFEYSDGNISFYLGNILLGSIDADDIPTDKLVFIQDLLGKDRANDINDTDVLKMAQLLQSLDANPLSDNIEINATTFGAFDDINSTFEDYNITNATNGLTAKSFALKEIERVRSHLSDMLVFHTRQNDQTFGSLSVVGTIPTTVAVDGDICVPFSQRIQKEYVSHPYFSLTADTSSASTPNYTVYRAGTAGNAFGNVSAPGEDDAVVCLDIDGNLTAGADYTLTIRGDIQNYAGISLGSTRYYSVSTPAPGPVVTPIPQAIEDRFIIEIDTTKVANSQDFFISSFNNNNLLIDCDGDGVDENATTSIELIKNGGQYRCNYPSEGVYRVAIRPEDSNDEMRLRFYMNDNNTTSSHKITQIEKWGDYGFDEMDFMFQKAINLTGIASGAGVPDMSNVTTIQQMFFGCIRFNADLNTWDVSNVTNMNSTFRSAHVFNGDISDWNTSSVTSMSLMFNQAMAFNQPLNSWDTSSVINMISMFNNAIAFNQLLNNWDTSNVQFMGTMFFNATVFNQDISGWDVSSVTSYGDMFTSATAMDEANKPVFPLQI